jgi:hypothetical protein
MVSFFTKGKGVLNWMGVWVVANLDVSSRHNSSCPSLSFPCAEAEAARGAIAKLTEEAEGAKRARAEALGRLERAGGTLAAQEAALGEARGQELRLVRALEEEHARCAALAAAALQVCGYGSLM